MGWTLTEQVLGKCLVLLPVMQECGEWVAPRWHRCTQGDRQHPPPTSTALRGQQWGMVKNPAQGMLPVLLLPLWSLNGVLVLPWLHSVGFAQSPTSQRVLEYQVGRDFKGHLV